MNNSEGLKIIEEPGSFLDGGKDAADEEATGF
jgi:hypothetical protein